MADARRCRGIIVASQTWYALLSVSTGPGEASVTRPVSRGQCHPCDRRSWFSSAKCIARPYVAAAQADGKPSYTLGRGSVGEAVRDGAPPRLPLQPVIANGGSGIDRLTYVGVVNIGMPLVHPVGPYAGKTVRHQFRSHRNRVGRGAIALHPLHLGQDAQKMLDMVADLMRDHVGIGEVAASAHAALHVLEE